MKGKLLGTVLLTLLSVNLNAQNQSNQPDSTSTQQATPQPPADTAPVPTTPTAEPKTPATAQPAQATEPQAPATTQPAQATEPQTPATTQPAPAVQKVNCEYNIPPETTTIDNDLVLEWAKHAAIQSFDLDHASLTQQFSALEACYTKEGWKGFNDALDKSGNLNAIKKQNLMVSSQISGNAEITALKDNQWKVTLPLQVVYKNDKDTLTQNLDVTLNIGRQTNGNLGIMQLIALPKQKGSEAQKPIQNTQTPEPDKTTPP